MNRRIRNLCRIAAGMTLVAVLGGAVVAPAAHAGPKSGGTTTDSGKKWK